MSQSFWVPTINPVQDGEQVNASVTDRPINQLAARSEFLRQGLQNLSSTSGHTILASAPIGASVTSGTVVYWESVSKTFQPALAELVSSGGSLSPTERSYAAGVCVNVSSGGLGDIAIGGYINPSDFSLNISGMLDDASVAFVPGVYYLSRQIPGKISAISSAPLTSLGHFSSTGITLSIDNKGILEGHIHQAFDLFAKPSAQLNYAGTGWYDFSGAGTDKTVDYSNKAVPTPIVLSIRGSGIPVSSPVRVEIYRSSASQYSIDIVSGITTPSGTGTTVTLSPANFPNYGDYIPVGTTGLQVAFIRQDNNYSSTLTADAAALLTLNTDRFKIYLPTDLTGWTNANPFDVGTPTGAKYRYLIEGQADLNAAFPPLPLSSSMLALNGAIMQSDTDYKVTLAGIWWVLTGTYAPWPTDYSPSGSGMVLANARNIRYYFTQIANPNPSQFVTTLQSGSPSISIVDCKNGNAASVGNLRLLFNLGMALDSSTTEGLDYSLAGATSEKLLIEPSVTELLPGNGIQLQRITPPGVTGSRYCGQVRVNTSLGMEGEFSSVELKGADEVRKDLFSYVSFPAPSIRASSAVAKVKLPEGLVAGSKVQVSAKVFGTVGTTTPQNAQFAVQFFLIRNGTDISALQASPLNAGDWSVQFSSYSQYVTLPSEIVLPTPSTFVNVTDSGDDSGQILVMQINRQIQSSLNVPDSYAGDVGIIGLRWAITT